MDKKSNLTKVYIDKVSFGVAFTLTIIGLLFIYSSEATQNFKQLLFVKQSLGFLLSLVCYIIFSRINYHRYVQYSSFVYLIGLGLLIFVVLFGSTINGSKSWISIGFFHLQPSEIAKLTYIMSFSAFIDRFQSNISRVSFFLISGLLLMPYFLLLCLQPDFGTGALFLFIFVAMVFLAGGNMYILFALIPIAFFSVLFPLLGYLFSHGTMADSWLSVLFWSKTSYAILMIVGLSIVSLLAFLHRIMHQKIILISLIMLTILTISFAGSFAVKTIFKNYHYKRILILMDPNLDPSGKGYNINQSLISIGSGKLFGYGLTKGPQNRGDFLPAKSTDFILALIGEEWGFVGILLIVLLNVFLIYRIFQIASDSRDLTGFLIAIGIATLFTAHFLVNVLSVIGFLPVIGIPLPFVSYGGSSLLTNYIALGILYNIKNNRDSLL